MRETRGQRFDARSVLLYYFAIRTTARECGSSYQHAVSWAKRLNLLIHRVGKEAYVSPSDQQVLRHALKSRAFHGPRSKRL